MAKTKISEYSTTAGANTDVDGINIDEGCPPANMNNAIRSLMAALKGWQGGTVAGDVLTVAGGGTGNSTYTNGQLLIGNTTGSTLTKATLTAGTGISITNGTGSITIASTGTAGVTTFNTRSGAVTLTSSDVTTALGATPVYTTTNQTVTGNKTFNGISGFNATPVTNYSIAANVSGTSGGAILATSTGTGGNLTPLTSQVSDTSTPLQVFYYNATNVGTISTNGTATAYNTTSDRRLKTNIQPLTNSGAFIDAIQPRTFTWVGNNQADVGFIADELQQIVPSAVTGEQNATRPDGSPLYQGIDCSTPEMIANIIAELQSLRQRVAALESN